MRHLPTSLVLQTIEALRQNVEALRQLEREGLPDPVASACIDSARSMLSRVEDLVADLDRISSI